MEASTVSAATGAAGQVLREMDPEKKIESLEEWVRWRARLVLFGLALAGYGQAKVICGYRSIGECEQLYGKGRTEEECAAAGVAVQLAEPEAEKVTWILPKYNRHWRRRAMDVDLTTYMDLNVEAIDHIARCGGMIYGGVWSVRDTYHFEV